jgi:hypothetical protein
MANRKKFVKKPNRAINKVDIIPRLRTKNNSAPRAQAGCCRKEPVSRLDAIMA